MRELFIWWFIAHQQNKVIYIKFTIVISLFVVCDSNINSSKNKIMGFPGMCKTDWKIYIKWEKKSAIGKV